MYIDIYMIRIIMTRKSGKHLHVTYGTLNNCFDLIGSHWVFAGFSSHYNSNITLIPPFKYNIILFSAHEVNVMWVHNTDLGRRSPGGGCVLCS